MRILTAIAVLILAVTASAQTTRSRHVLSGSAPLPRYYVDSVAGNNSNTGLSEGAPKASLAAVQALITSKGGTVYLKRGSTWREEFDIPTNNVAIAVYGTGAMPIIDGADVAGTWTQPDAGTYPNVWSQSWTRTSATTTASEYLGYWENGTRPRYASNATTDLQTNGGWFSSDLTAQTSTVSIKSAADPNSDGILREITRRHYGISGHTTTLGVTRTGQSVTGPIEIKRCVGHYNAYPGGTGPGGKRLFLRDGNIHHSVTESALTEDVVATEYSPATAPSVFVSYANDGTAFDHTFRRCMALLPGGASLIGNVNTSGFYGHSSTPGTMRNQTLEGCVVRGGQFAGPAAVLLTVSGGYAEDAYGNLIGATAATNVITDFVARDTVSPGVNHNGLRRIGTPTLSVDQSAFYVLGNGGSNVVQLFDTSAVTLTRSVFMSSTGFTAILAISGAVPAVTKCVVWGARPMDGLVTGYTGDYNVFYFVGGTNAIFGYNGSTYGTLALFQAASGQDAHSVFLKNTDQTASNANAFWLGVSTGANSGPASGDFRINPSAKVYKGDGTALTGLFADGVTPITAAGPQEHYDFNVRTIVAGPPTKYPTLPANVTEARTYTDSPLTWNFYP